MFTGIFTMADEDRFDPDYIKVIDGRWRVNRRQFSEMTHNERQVLAEKIKS